MSTSCHFHSLKTTLIGWRSGGVFAHLEREVADTIAGIDWGLVANVTEIVFFSLTNWVKQENCRILFSFILSMYNTERSALWQVKYID